MNQKTLTADLNSNQHATHHHNLKKRYEDFMELKEKEKQKAEEGLGDDEERKEAADHDEDSEEEGQTWDELERDAVMSDRVKRSTEHEEDSGRKKKARRQLFSGGDSHSHSNSNSNSRETIQNNEKM